MIYAITKPVDVHALTALTPVEGPIGVEDFAARQNIPLRRLVRINLLLDIPRPKPPSHLLVHIAEIVHADLMFIPRGNTCGVHSHRTQKGAVS
jgi:hypothetical protein